MARIIIYISGGNYQGAVSDTPGVEVMVVDHDNIAAGDPRPDQFETVVVETDDFSSSEEGSNPA